MRNIKVRVAALTMASVLMCSSVGLLVGCKKKSVDDGIHVPDDAIWYDTVKLDLKSPYDDVELSYGMMHDPVYIKDNLYVLVTGEERFDTSLALKDPNFDFNDYAINSLLQYDMKGNFIKEFDLGGIEGLNDLRIKSISECDGNIKLNVVATDAQTWMTSNYLITIDPKSGETKECVPCYMGDTMSTELENTIKVGEYEVNVVYSYGATANDYNLIITRGTEIVNTVDVAKETGIFFDDINQFFTVDDDTIVMTCYSEEGIMTGKLKVSTGEFTVSQETLGNLGAYYFMTEQNGKSLAVDSEGIWQINSNLEVEPAISFANTYINANSAATGNVAYYDGDMAILFVDDQSFSVTLPQYSVYIITKAKSNPNAGKTILDVYVMSDSLSYSEAEGILQFNSTNPDYYARVSFADLDFEGLTDARKENDMMNVIANQLIADITGGDGPDVILDGASIKQLNNPEVLLDLNEYINGDSGIDKSSYFTNIIDNAASSDGALYQFPVTYSIGGILAYQADVGDDKVGFTFDEYQKFVDQICNGKNPITLSKFDFFIDCIAREYVDYLADGKVNFDTPEFKELAEYASKYVFDTIEDEEEETFDYVVFGGENPIMDGPIDTIINKPEDIVYQASNIHSSIGMYGYPGVSGNDGPTAYVNSSAAISATIKDEMKGAAWEFIKTMISEDVQKMEKDGNPVNIAAYTYKTQIAMEDMNASYDANLKSGMDESELAQYGMYRIEDFIVEDILDIARSITSVNSIDTSVKKIVYEEMGAYFAGQKDLDAIIEILNNRVQTIVDERGVV